MLGVIRPIENSPACSNAACHPIRPGSACSASSTPIFAGQCGPARGAKAATSSSFLAVAILLVSLLGVAFIWLVIHRPVKELTIGTRRVAMAISYRLPVRSRRRARRAGPRSTR